MNILKYTSNVTIALSDLVKKISFLTEKQIIWFGLGLVFIALFFRNSAAIYPGLLDEFYYNQYARLLPFSEARYGNFLYYFIFRATNACGNGFLSCAYFINVAFYCAAFFPIYAIAKQCCDRPLALWVSFLAILAPFNIWTAFFMPESLYFLVFWMYVWALLLFKEINLSLRWIFAGAMLGICALIKIHAFFLLPASCLYIVYLATVGEKKNTGEYFKEAGWHLTFFIVSFLTIKFGIGYLLAGTSGLTLLGSYGGMVSHASDAVSEITSITQPVQIDPRFTPLAILKREGARAIWVNVLPIFLLYSPALMVLWLSVRKNLALNNGTRVHGGVKADLGILTILIIMSMVLIITTYQLILISKGMGAAELYWRYYEFTFPLLFLVAAASVNEAKNTHQKISVMQLLIASLFILMVCWAMYRGAGTQWISPSHKNFIFYVVGTLSILTLVILPFRAKFALNIFIFAALPCILIASNLAIYKELKHIRISPNDSSVGNFINSRLSKSELSKLVVVQDNNLTQTVPMMYFNQAPIEFISIPESQKQYDLAQLPSGKDWVLLMGNHELKGEALNKPHQELIHFGAMTLFGGHGDMVIDFKNTQWKGLISSHSGLYTPPEPWGAWSIGNKIKLDFVKPLPRKFNIVLNARAFGPNSKLDFVLKIGSQLIPFKVRVYPEFENIVIPVENYSRLSSLEIEIPNPLSPKDLGLGDDDRKLGIGLTQLQIQW